MIPILWQGRSVRRESGKRYRISRRKKRFEVGRAPADTTLGEARSRLIRTRGGNLKVRALRTQYANVSVPATGETRKARIETVVENRADPNYMRRNILTRGAVIKTELGKARVLSRPAQDGVVNAVLLEEGPGGFSSRKPKAVLLEEGGGGLSPRKPHAVLVEEAGASKSPQVEAETPPAPVPAE